MSDPAPPLPRLPAALLRRALPADRREDLLGDLEEQYRRQAEARGTSAARRWFWKQALGIGWLYSWERLRERAVKTAKWIGRGAMFEETARDVRHALRGFRKNPGFTAVAVLTLALGIGGNTAVFSVVDRVLLRPLPYPESDRLVAIHETRQGDSWWSGAPDNVLEWRERSRRLADVAWSQPRGLSLTGLEEPEQVDAMQVSANYLDVLGVSPALGRDFQEQDDVRGAAPTVILSHEFWVRRFGADPGILDRSLSLDGEPTTVVGVLAPGQAPSYLGQVDVLIPRVFTEAELTSMGRVLQAVGRLADGATLEQAAGEMDRIAAELDARSTNTSTGWGVRLVPLKDQVVGDVRPVLMVLLAAVGLVLLVACANVSNLLLARASRRTREMALRRSLGAGRGRLVRQQLVEACLLAGIGGVAGLLLASWGTDALLALSPGVLADPALSGPALGGQGVEVDARILLFTLSLSVGTGVLFGLVPALRSSRVDIRGSLGDGGDRQAGDRRLGRLHDHLVAAELALVVMLLLGAGLMLRSFQSLRSVDPGIQTEGRVYMALTLPATRYASNSEVADFTDRLRERLLAVPGVVEAGAVTHVPLAHENGWTGFVIPESRPEPEPGNEFHGGFEAAGPGYFQALGIPLLEGRTFEAGDRADSRPVAVVNQAAADLFWPDRSPLGDRVRTGPANTPTGGWMDIVGVVGSVRYDLDDTPRPRVYMPLSQMGFLNRSVELAVRTEGAATASVIRSLPASVADVDPDQPIAGVRRMDEVASASLARVRFQTLLLTVFAAVALLLGSVGVYGVVAYAVSRKTREMGVRMALGAAGSRVLGMVLAEALKPVILGAAMGVLGALLLSGVLSSQLFQVSPTDPWVFLTVPPFLVAVAALASLVPGLRATRIDPAASLRAE